jgi:ATP-dependent Clp protease ATP-binding subunit ClpA
MTVALQMDKGRVVDFRNTVIVMTSNLGATYSTTLAKGQFGP